MNKYELLHINEPKLLFANQQTAIDPRDGLLLFGPYQKLSPYRVIAGVVSTSKGLSLYKKYVDTINGPILSTKTTYGTTHTDEISRPSFPGFESIFNIKWDRDAQIHCRINEEALNSILNERNKKVRINKLVSLPLNC